MLVSLEQSVKVTSSKLANDGSKGNHPPEELGKSSNILKMLVLRAAVKLCKGCQKGKGCPFPVHACSMVDGWAGTKHHHPKSFHKFLVVPL